MTHFLRYTCVTLPSRSLYFPRTIRTSSSLRIGSDRTLYLVRSSLDKGDDMILRRTEEGAEKCALRDLRREDETSGLNFILILRTTLTMAVAVDVGCMSDLFGPKFGIRKLPKSVLYNSCWSPAPVRSGHQTITQPHHG